MAKIDFTDKINDARLGDQEAVRFIYDNTINLFYKEANVLIHDKDEADNAIRDAYIYIFGHLDSIKDPSTFLVWATEICKNTCIARLKMKGIFDEKTPLGAANIGDIAPASDYDNQINPNAVMEQSHVRACLEAILESLPDDQRVCSVLWGEGYPVSNIARKIGRSKSSVNYTLASTLSNITNIINVLRDHGLPLFSMDPIPYFLWLLQEYYQVYELKNLDGIYRSDFKHLYSVIVPGAAYLEPEAGVPRKIIFNEAVHEEIDFETAGLKEPETKTEVQTGTGTGSGTETISFDSLVDQFVSDGVAAEGDGDSAAAAAGAAGVAAGIAAAVSAEASDADVEEETPDDGSAEEVEDETAEEADDETPEESGEETTEEEAAEGEAAEAETAGEGTTAVTPDANIAEDETPAEEKTGEDQETAANEPVPEESTEKLSAGAFLPPEEEEKKSRKGLIIFAAIIILLICLAAVGLTFFRDTVESTIEKVFGPIFNASTEAVTTEESETSEDGSSDDNGEQSGKENGSEEDKDNTDKDDNTDIEPEGTVTEEESVKPGGGEKTDDKTEKPGGTTTKETTTKETTAKETTKKETTTNKETTTQKETTTKETTTQKETTTKETTTQKETTTKETTTPETTTQKETTTPETTTQKETTTQEETTTGFRAWINTPGWSLVMHVLPNVNTAEVWAVPNNTEVYVDQLYEDWGHISYEGYEGWIWLGYARFN